MTTVCGIQAALRSERENGGRVPIVPNGV